MQGDDDDRHTAAAMAAIRFAARAEAYDDMAQADHDSNGLDVDDDGARQRDDDDDDGDGNDADDGNEGIHKDDPPPPLPRTPSASRAFLAQLQGATAYGIPHVRRGVRGVVEARRFLHGELEPDCAF